MSEKKDRDMQILSQLYSGNHLEDYELERALKLLYLMKVELRGRVEYKKIKERGEFVQEAY